MELILSEYCDQVAVLKLNRGVTNALDAQLVSELAESLRRARQEPRVSSLVLTSTSAKFLSIGLDIPALFDLPEAAFAAFYQSFNELCLELYTFPKPTVAAVTGHAIAGGCILALCCDYRLIAEGRKSMGLNEVKLAVPVPYLADCILRQLVGTRNAREIMGTGEFYQPPELLQMGMVDRTLPVEQVLPEAIEKARQLGRLPQQAWAMIKRNRVEAVEAEVLAHGGEKERTFVACWYSPEARERLREAMSKF